MSDTDKQRLMNEFANLNAKLEALDAGLQKYGERDLADAVKRARREIELVDRQGIPQVRGL